MVIAVIFEAPETTWSLVMMIPRASMMDPEPSDWLVRLRGRLSKPKKKSSKTEGRRRRICSAEMLTTAGETFSTTWTISLRRVERGVAEATAAAASRRRAAGRRFTCSTTAHSAPAFRPVSSQIAGKQRAPPRGGAGTDGNGSDYFARTSIVSAFFGDSPAVILIVRGLASSRLGSSTFRSPWEKSARIFSRSTLFGRLKLRTNWP